MAKAKAQEYGAAGGRIGDRLAKRWWATVLWSLRKGAHMDVRLMVLSDKSRTWKRKDGAIEAVREIEAVDWSKDSPCSTPLRVALSGEVGAVGTLVRKEVTVRITSYRVGAFGVQFEGRLM